MGGDEGKKPQTAPLKETPIWMKESTVEGSQSEAFLPVWHPVYAHFAQLLCFAFFAGHISQSSRSISFHCQCTRE
jgi:hypothetical protein